jgi:hypothetical protein
MIHESIKIFANNETVDMQELDRMLEIAFEDGKLDEDEKRVLGQFFDLAEDGKLTDDVRARIGELREKYKIKGKDRYLEIVRNYTKLVDD